MNVKNQQNNQWKMYLINYFLESSFDSRFKSSFGYSFVTKDLYGDGSTYQVSNAKNNTKNVNFENRA